MSVVPQPPLASTRPTTYIYARNAPDADFNENVPSIMLDSTAGDIETGRARPARVFPLVRHLSARLTPVLVRLPVTANQITFASLLFGLGSGWCMALATWTAAVVGGVLLVMCYVLDNCDGEIARLKNQSSEFGRRFDNFVDWAVHTAFFAALGWGSAKIADQSAWLWLGAVAAAGSTINYVIGTVAEERQAARNPRTADREELAPAADPIAARPAHWRHWITFAFRELSRADFCFIVLALALFDFVWILLPLGAFGAQVFWIAHLLPDARKYHV